MLMYKQVGHGSVQMHLMACMGYNKLDVASWCVDIRCILQWVHKSIGKHLKKVSKCSKESPQDFERYNALDDGNSLLAG